MFGQQRCLKYSECNYLNKNDQNKYVKLKA